MVLAKNTIPATHHAQAQEIFNTVATHLFTQGRQAINEDSDGFDGVACRYRASDGARCAVGALIADEVYDFAMEGQNIDALLLGLGDASPAYPELAWMIPLRSLLSNLQDIHDYDFNWRSGTEMRSALREVADAHRLDASILATLRFADARA